MKKYTRLAACSLLLFITTNTAVADIYKCVDKNGHVVFQPDECSGSVRKAEKIDVERMLSKQNRVSAPTKRYSVLNTNLLHNPKFEHQLDNWKVKTHSYWFPNKGVNGTGVLQIDAPEAPKDKYIHETVVSQCVPIHDGVKFTLGGYFHHEGRPEKQSANRVRVYWYESIDCTTGGQYGWHAQPRDVTGWQRLSYENLKPALLAKAARIDIMQNGSYSNRAKAYWDNVFLVATEVSTVKQDKPGYVLPANFDFIENGDFKHDLSAWRVSSKSEWVGYAGHRYTGAIKVTSKSSSGSRGSGAFSQCVNIGAGTHFDVGASFKRADTSTQKGGGRLRVTWYEKDDCTGRAKTSNRSADPTDSKGWQQLQVKGLQAPPQSTSVKVELIQSIAGRGEFSAYWDDVYFKTSK